MLDKLIGGGLIGGAANVIGGLLDFGANKQANKQAKELAKYQYDLNMQAWREQTDYNKPINQIARLKEAGLNPQLAYGNGTQAGNASPAPSYQAPTIQKYSGAQTAMQGAASTATAIYQSLLAAQKQKEELKLLASQREYNTELSNKARAEALYIASKKGGQDISNELLGFQREVQRETYNREVEAFNRDMELKDAELQLKGSQIDNLSSQTRLNLAKVVTESFLRQQLKATIAKLYADARLTNAHAYWQEERNKLAKNFTRADFALLQNQVTKALREGRATQLSNIINKWFADRAKNGYHPYGVTSPWQTLEIGADYAGQIINGIFSLEGMHNPE